jgi:hypothetical protein
LDSKNQYIVKGEERTDDIPKEIEGEGGDPSIASAAPEVPVKTEKAEKRVKASTLTSWAKGVCTNRFLTSCLSNHVLPRQKLDVRVRKRDNLPADSIYRSKKYDAAFTSPKLMSDDEDEIVDGKKTG